MTIHRTPGEAEDFSKQTQDFRWPAAIAGGLLMLLFSSFHAGYLDAAWLPLVVGAGGAYWVGKSRFKAWPRTWLACTVLTWLLPISALVFGASATAEVAAQDEDGFATAGAAIGTGLGILLIGFLSFFVGIVLTLVTYFQFKSAKEKQRQYESQKAARL